MYDYFLLLLQSVVNSWVLVIAAFTSLFLGVTKKIGATVNIEFKFCVRYIYEINDNQPSMKYKLLHCYSCHTLT
jgi:hypothetical protein